jgi:hypothetical protein
MNFRDRVRNNPRIALTIGMTCLLLSSLPRFIHVTTHLNPDAVDFARGVLIGMSIGFNLLWVRLNANRSRCAR